MFANKTIIIYSLDSIIYIMFRATPENINFVYNKMPTQTGQSVYNSNANQPLIYE